MKQLIATLLTAVSVLGCDEKPRSEPVYRILIGEQLSPNYQDIQIGQIFGSQKNIMAFGKDPFGNLNVKILAEEKSEGVFTEGGIVLNMKSCTLILSGDLTEELKMVVMKEVKSGDYMIVSKHAIPKKKGFQMELAL